MSNDQLTEEQIKHAYQIAAKVVRLHGDKYLPIFQRLHIEMEKIKQNEQIKAIALSVSSDIVDEN